MCSLRSRQLTDFGNSISENYYKVKHHTEDDDSDGDDVKCDIYPH